MASNHSDSSGPFRTDNAATANIQALPAKPSGAVPHRSKEPRARTRADQPDANRDGNTGPAHSPTFPRYSPRSVPEAHEDQRALFGSPPNAFVWHAMDCVLASSPIVDLTEGHPSVFCSPSMDQRSTRSPNTPIFRSPVVDSKQSRMAHTPAERSTHAATGRRHSSGEALSPVGLGMALAEDIARTVSRDSCMSATSFTSSSGSSNGSSNSGSSFTTSSGYYSWSAANSVTIEEELDPDAPPRYQQSGPGSSRTDEIDPLAPAPTPQPGSKAPAAPIFSRHSSRRSSVACSTNFLQFTPSAHDGWDERNGWIQLGRGQDRDIQARMLLLQNERGNMRRASEAATTLPSPDTRSGSPTERWQKLHRRAIERLMRSE